MNTKRIVVAHDGMWFSEFEYKKHHQEEYPSAVVFEILEQDEWEADHAYSNAMAKILSRELTT